MSKKNCRRRAARPKHDPPPKQKPKSKINWPLIANVIRFVFVPMVIPLITNFLKDVGALLS